jgi:outer membrane protein OmpA-like peptidoglycan-associated protein
MMTSKIAWIPALIMMSGLAAGCGSVPPPKELVDARAAYQRAESSAGAALAPVPLHEARLALDKAERAYLDDADSIRARDLAYVAERKADLAVSSGNAVSAARTRDQGLMDLAALGAQDLANAKQGLHHAQGELTRTRDQLEMTAEQLAAEKKAREAAEKRSREAMDKLALASALAIKEEPRGTVIMLPGSVLFASGKADLLPTAQVKLNAVADALKDQDDRKIVVEGHTDSQGSEQSNMVLSQRRAQSVRDYLVSRGVAADAISASGVGQGRPIADNKSAEGRADNRRVEIVIQNIEKR